ncbi:MAG: ABC transporter substrate-binding protein [Myxococcota bacterium]
MTHALRFGRRALLSGLLASKAVPALGRRPYGGTLRLVVPWGMSRLDPHELDDPIAALFWHLISDPLFALYGGRPYPALARSLPEAIPNGARLRLRPGLVTARGRALSALDVKASIERSQRRGGAALFAQVKAMKTVSGDPLSLDVIGPTPDELGVSLASPVAALLPRNFSPLEPDGTGPYKARLGAGELVLTRNDNAVRGAAFLDSVEARTVADLSEALRAFENGNVDVGWLGSGLHQARSGAVQFVGAAYGFLVLRSGKKPRQWGAPGVAQQLIDGIAPERLRHLGLKNLPERALASEGWGGGPAECLVPDDAPQLRLAAQTLAAALSRPGHELNVVALSRGECARRRSSGDFALLVDFVRIMGQPGPMTQLSLLTAENPELAKRPPRITDFNPRVIARSLSLGVVGELWVEGAHAPAFRGLTGWQLGDAYRLPAPNQ